ncbi:MAG: alpha/beta hydrolase [Thermoleophilia bacterium]|nr:alpha/beta hydrolase [Thermoleophilia bacterium]
MTRPHVVLLHAFPLDCRMWADVKPALERAGYLVAAPDLPGPPADSTLAGWSERILDTVEGPLIPVGASMGGYVAWELWLQARERIPALALVGSRASGETEPSRAARDEQLALLDESGVPGVWARLEEALFAPAAGRDVVARAREIALEQGTERVAAALVALRDRADRSAMLADARVPALVVVGEEDAIVPDAEAEALARSLPDARLVRVPGAGHLVALERPEETARALLAFLAEVTG